MEPPQNTQHYSISTQQVPQPQLVELLPNQAGLGLHELDANLKPASGKFARSRGAVQGRKEQGKQQGLEIESGLEQVQSAYQSCNRDSYDYIEEFLDARRLSLNSIKSYRQDLNQFQHWANIPWQQVSESQIDRYAVHLLKTCAESTVCRKLSALKSFYSWMRKRRYVQFDPTQVVELPKPKQPQAQHLELEEIEQIEQVVDLLPHAERNRALIGVLLHGLRAAEVCGLNLGDYDGTRLKIREAKRDSTGVVPLNRKARNALDAYLGWRVLQGEAVTQDAPLFISTSNRAKGKRLSYDGIRKLFEKIGAQIEQMHGQSVPELHAHQLRHTYITNLLLKGVDPYHAMTLSRHRSPSSFRRYSKAADQAAAERAFFELES